MDLVKNVAETAAGQAANCKELIENRLKENETLKKAIEGLKAQIAKLAGDTVADAAEEAGKQADAAEEAGEKAAEEAEEATDENEKAEKLLKQKETLAKTIEGLKAKLAELTGAEEAGKEAAEQAAGKAEEAEKDALGSMGSMKKSLPF